MPADKQKHADLEARALELVLECQRAVTNDESALLAFKSRSPQHAQALDRAQQFLQLSRQVTPPARTIWSSLSYAIELQWARWSETRLSLAAPVALAASMVVAIIMVLNINAPDETALAQQAISPAVLQDYDTGWRERRNVTLQDGSSVWLDWRTSLRTEIGPDSRTVFLDRGTAAFKVVSEPDRPFFVISGDVQTEVTGTEFLVSRQSDEQLEVAVLEGQVIVSATNQGQQPINKEQVVKIENGFIGKVESRPADEIGQWRDGMLVFNGRPLLDALSRIQPYTRYALDTRQIADHPGEVSGVFFIDQADEALFAILQTHRIEYAVKDGNRLRLQQASLSRP
ncbi:MAG: FecR domain-containing protein [Pseudomonadota bacterium]